MTLQMLIIFILAGAIFLFLILPPMIVALVLYLLLLVRTSKKKWTRECSEKDNEEQLAMYSAGIQWKEENKEFMQSISINNGKIKLRGEYFNFGFDKAVIIIAGRAEGCMYSCFYAKPYRNLGYNVLVIDNRCHGLSDGKFLTFGIKEYEDILLWGKFLNENCGIKSILLHGICIGSATALHALTSGDVPQYFKGMIAEGVFTTFYDSFRNHIVSKKHPVFPVQQEVFMLVRIFSGVNAKRNGPIYCIERLEKPVLFIHSRKDIFCLPEEAQRVYEKCNAPKKIVWFENGGHSHIRINNENEYDRAVADFAGNL